MEHIADHMNVEGTDWYSSPAEDLYLRDFVWFTQMQTACRMTERYCCFPHRDKVLDCLLEEGSFDRREPDLPNAQEQFAMAYSASMVQHLLVRIEHLESEASVSALSCR